MASTTLGLSAASLRVKIRAPVYRCAQTKKKNVKEEDDAMRQQNMQGNDTKV